MSVIMLQAIPSFYEKISEKNLFISAKTFEKYIVCKDYCIVHHDDTTCFLSACKYHIMLLGEIENLLHKLDTFCFSYQHVDCLYTLFNYRFSGKIIAYSGIVSDNVQKAISFNQRNGGTDKIAEYCKKETPDKKVQTTFYECSPKEQINADQWFSVCRKNWKSQKD